MKTYNTPKLVAKGDVIALTLGIDPGEVDPSGTQQVLPLGSVGFNL
jgi:hypothetical protein